MLECRFNKTTDHIIIIGCTQPEVQALSAASRAPGTRSQDALPLSRAWETAWDTFMVWRMAAVASSALAATGDASMPTWG